MESDDERASFFFVCMGCGVAPRVSPARRLLNRSSPSSLQKLVHFFIHFNVNSSRCISPLSILMSTHVVVFSPSALCTTSALRPLLSCRCCFSSWALQQSFWTEPWNHPRPKCCARPCATSTTFRYSSRTAKGERFISFFFVYAACFSCTRAGDTHCCCYASRLLMY